MISISNVRIGRIVIFKITKSVERQKMRMRNGMRPRNVVGMGRRFGLGSLQNLGAWRR